MAFNPSQPRDKDGKWTDSSGNISGNASSTSKLVPMMSMVGRIGKDAKGNYLNRGSLARAIVNRQTSLLVGRAYADASGSPDLMGNEKGTTLSLYRLGSPYHSRDPRNDVMGQPRGSTRSEISKSESDALAAVMRKQRHNRIGTSGISSGPRKL